VSRCFEQWEQVRSTLACCATGCGKTRIGAEIIHRFLPKRTMFVAHRTELITQAQRAIDEIISFDNDLFSAHQCEIEMADTYARHHAGLNSPVIAMVQSLNTKAGFGRRMDRFDPMQFGLLIVDEVHHGVAQSYQAVINYFKRNPDLKILGLTATPDRLDEESLGQICESVAFDYEINNAIDDGWLVRVEQIMVPVSGLDFSHVKTTMGDLNQSDLAAIMEAESVVQSVVQPTLEVMFRLKPHELDKVDPKDWEHYLTRIFKDPRRTLVFTVSVNQAEMLANIFNRVIPGVADWVCGKTSEKQRDEKVHSFRCGEVPIMVNCGVFTEGFDSPEVSLIVQAKPTKSRALYSQMVGRGTRPLPGLVDQHRTAEARCKAIADSVKPSVIVLDFKGNSGRHKLITTVDLLGGNVTDQTLERAQQMMDKLGKVADTAEIIAEAEEDLKAEADARRRAEELRKHKIVARTAYSMRSVDPFDVFDITPVKTRGWDVGRVLSAKETNLLMQQGINPDGMEYSAAKALVIEIMTRFRLKQCSFKQAALLKKYDLPTTVSRTQASEWLNAIAANHWQKPGNLVTA